MALEIDLLKYEKGKRHWLDPLEKYKHVIDEMREEFLKEHTKDAYDPSEARDPSGKWTEGSGSGGSTTRLSELGSRGFNTSRVLYHQTSAQAHDKILQDGFDLNKAYAILTDPVVPNGVFLKPTSEDIGVGGEGGEGTKQIPVVTKLKKTLKVETADELRTKLSQDAEYKRLVNKADRVDQDLAKEFKEKFETVSLRSLKPEQRSQRIADKDEFLNNWQTENEKHSTAARNKATQLLKEQGYDSVEIVKDAGGLGKKATTTIVVFGGDDSLAHAKDGKVLPIKELRTDNKTIDAYDPAEKRDPGGKWTKGGGGGGSTKSTQKPWIQELAEKEKNRPGVVSRTAHSAVHGAVHLLGEFSKEDYEILKHHLAPNSATRHQFASRILKIATLLPKLLQAHFKEEYHKFKNAAGALKALATGKRPTSKQWRGLRQAATTVLLTGAVFMLTGDPTGGHVAQAATHGATQVAGHGATQVAGHVATQVAGHGAEQAVEHTAAAAAAHLTAEFGHELVTHTMYEHAGKFGLGALRIALRLAVSAAVGAGATHLKKYQEEDTNDALPDNTPIDANEMKLLQDYLQTLANVAWKHPIQDKALYDSLPDKKENKTQDEYDPSEKRDESGKWTAGGGSAKAKEPKEEDDDYEEPAYSDPSEKIAPEYHEPQPTPAKPSDNFTPPKKTVKAYKLFETKPDQPGKLFPLFIDSSTSVPIGEWMPGKPVPTKSFAPRPGWHAGELPLAPHLRDSATRTKIAPSRVWAEVEMPDDEDWQSKADKNGRMSKGTKKSPSHWIAGEIKDQVPHGGHYKFNTKPGQGGTWLIGGAIRVKKVLTDDEVHDILTKAGKHEDAKHETNRSEPYPFKHSKTKDSRWRFLHVHTIDSIFRIRLKDAAFNPADHPHAPEGAPQGKGGQFVAKGSKPSGGNTESPKKRQTTKATNTPKTTTPTPSRGSGALKGNQGHPGLISTALPKGKNDEFNKPNLELAKTDPKKFALQIQVFKDHPSAYPLNQQELEGDDNTVAKNIIEHIKSNLKFIHDQTPKELRERTKKWYEGARKLVDEHVENYKEYNLKDTTVAGVYATLSPNNLWDQNVRQGDRMVDIYLKHRHEPWDEKMDKAVERTKNETVKTAMQDIAGKKYDELDTPEKKALWFRVYDEGHAVDNPEYKELGFQPFNKITPEGKREGWYTKPVNVHEFRAFAWTSTTLMGKAIRILEADGDPKVIDEALQTDDGSPPQHKVRSFYNNILDPHSKNEDVTMDTHAVDAAWLIDNPIAVAHNFGDIPELSKRPKAWVSGTPGGVKTGMTGNYAFNAEAYREAAHDLHLEPRELQSIVWETKRKWMETMTDENHKKMRDVWNDYSLGHLTQSEAQKQVKQIIDDDLKMTSQEKRDRAKQIRQAKAQAKKSAQKAAA